MLWLEPISPDVRDRAVADLDAGDVVAFLCRAGNTYSLDLVWKNISGLQKRGVYERALIEAFTITRKNNWCWPVNTLRLMFEIADRDRLREAGEPLPGSGPFTLYRGVAGRGRARRVRGLSWTADLEKACLFANRLPSLADPRVFQVTVDAEDVLAYSNGREEQEFIVLLPDSARPQRIEKGR